MSGGFVTKNSSGHVMIDSRKIQMGLIKSGYLQPIDTWIRYYYQAMNSTTPTPDGRSDVVYGFTVKATNPIVFIAGRGKQMHSSRSGEFITFYFNAASTSTRYYVFDNMKDLGSGTKLKLRDQSGIVTFDSGQPPLNIVATITPPAPPFNNAQYYGYGLGYAGGTSSWTQDSGSTSIYAITAWSQFTTFIGGTDLATSMPWNRAMSCCSADGWNNSIGCSEGVYGDGSSITFIMATDAGYTYNPWFRGSWPGVPGYGVPMFFGIPIDRIPQALVIDAANLPIPFDIT